MNWQVDSIHMRYMLPLKFLLAPSRLLKFIWCLVALFICLSAVSLAIGNADFAIFLWRFAFGFIGIIILHLPLYLNSLLVKKSLILCGNAYSKLIWVAIFLGVISAFLYAPLGPYRDYYSAQYFLTDLVYFFFVYTLWVAVGSAFNIVVSYILTILFFLTYAHSGLARFVVFYPELALPLGALVSMFLWGRLFSLRGRVKLSKIGFLFLGFMSGRYFGDYSVEHLRELKKLNLQELVSFMASHVIPKKYNARGANLEYFAVGRMAISLGEILIYGVYGLLLCIIGIAPFLIAKVLLDGSNDFMYFFKHVFLKEGFVFLCMISVVFIYQIKITPRVRVLWLMCGNRGMLLKLIVRYSCCCIFVNTVMSLFLLVSFYIFFGSIEINAILMAVVLILLSFVFLYTTILSFCLRGAGKNWLIYVFSCLIIVTFHVVAYAYYSVENVFVSCGLIVFLTSNLMFYRHYSEKLWRHASFQ